MPTFEDPRQHAVEAHQALRALAHATRVFTNLADTYPVIGDLLAAARSLRQVVDQLAAAHITHRARAHDDAGNQAVGDAAALAAGDELHQVGTLLIEVEARLDAASQHTGRIAWHSETGPAGMNTPDAARTTTHAGTLTLTVWPDTPVGDHQRYAYRIQETTGHTISGRDLFTGAGDQVEPAQALRDRAGYLSATGQARQHALDHPDQHTGHQGLFPDDIAEAARVNTDALRALAEHGPQGIGPGQAARQRWISVVFLQGADADEVLDLIERNGTDAAIEHLAHWDFEEETTQAALENGYVYDTVPQTALDRVTSTDLYTLTYNPFLGHVSLLRSFDAIADPALSGTNSPAPEHTRSRGKGSHREVAAPRREAADIDWFARTGSSTVTPRGLAL